MGIIPYYISSLNARIYAFPELLGIRKFNKKGEEYTIKHINSDIRNNHLVPFADYPFDCDKKNVVMNLVCEKFPEINWVYNKNGDFKKENYDACDSLVCSLAYSNLKRYGILNPKICSCDIEVDDDNFIINYGVNFWDVINRKKIKICK